jgi:hypothetical protein
VSKYSEFQLAREVTTGKFDASSTITLIEEQATNGTVNIMKALKIAMFLTLGGIAAQAFSAESAATVEASKIPVETYTYSTRLDVQKVIAITDIADQCGPVPMQMTYEDSQGQRHVLQYQVMGTGCSNG